MDQYIYISLDGLVTILFLMGMATGLLLFRSVKDVLAWQRWIRHRHLNRPPPVDGWKVRIPRQP